MFCSLLLQDWHRDADIGQNFISLLTTCLKCKHGLLEVGTEKMAEPVHHFSDDRQYALPEGERHQVALRLPEQYTHGFIISEPLV